MSASSPWRRPWILAVVLGALAAGGCVGGGGSGPTAESDAGSLDSLTVVLARQLRCPVCRQLSVEDSPSELAQEVKDVIRGRLEQGETPEEVRAYFVSKYGEWILLEPPKEGFNLVVWLVPLLGLVAGGAILGASFRSWLASGAGATLKKEGTDEAESPEATADEPARRSG